MIRAIYPLSKNILSQGQSLSLFFARIAVAYGFYEPAMMKWEDMTQTANNFADYGIPLPTLNAYLAGTAELLGVILLALGLFTRLISIPLIIVMIVAIITVHIPMEHDILGGIPLYYMLFLALFASLGAGKLSLDYLLFGQEQ